MILLISEKREDFDNELKNVTWNKNELKELSNKDKAMSAKGLTKYFINTLIILNGAKYCSSGIFQDYLVFVPTDSWKSNRMSKRNWKFN